MSSLHTCDAKAQNYARPCAGRFQECDEDTDERTRTGGLTSRTRTGTRARTGTGTARTRTAARTSTGGLAARTRAGGHAAHTEAHACTGARTEARTHTITGHACTGNPMHAPALTIYALGALHALETMPALPMVHAHALNMHAPALEPAPALTMLHTHALVPTPAPALEALHALTMHTPALGALHAHTHTHTHLAPCKH
eukprot:1146567-Pelagomonas_calceolata.AAC.2